jgi:hypothetical protein
MANEPDQTPSSAQGGKTPAAQRQGAAQSPPEANIPPVGNAESKDAKQTEPDSGEPKLDASAWAERARSVFKQSPHAVRGALFGQEGTEWTEDEVRAALDEFSVREGT